MHWADRKVSSWLLSSGRGRFSPIPSGKFQKHFECCGKVILSVTTDRFLALHLSPPRYHPTILNLPQHLFEKLQFGITKRRPMRILSSYRSINYICALLRFDAKCNCSLLLRFWDSLSPPSSKGMRCPEIQKEPRS
jgi:hypothetical protein